MLKMNQKLKLCVYCNKMSRIFKNATEGPQCLFCYKKERAVKHQKLKIQKKLPKKKSRMDLIGRTDLAFSLLVKMIHSRGEAPNRIVTCFTCDKDLALVESDCGHCISRGNFNTRWMLDNCRPQCIACNRYQGGNIEKFKKRLEAETPGIVERLEMLGKVPFNPSEKDLEEIRENIMKELRKFKRNQ
jgi:hypothetical protein